MANKNGWRTAIITTSSDIITKRIRGKITVNKIAELLGVSVDDIEVVNVGEIYNKHLNTPKTMFKTTKKTNYTEYDENGNELNNKANFMLSLCNIDTDDKYYGTVVFVMTEDTEIDTNTNTNTTDNKVTGIDKLYHITDTKNAYSIIHNGLKANENGDVFLFENKSVMKITYKDYIPVADVIAVEQLFLDKYMMFEVDVRGLELSTDDVGELTASIQYIYRGDISADRITPFGIFDTKEYYDNLIDINNLTI